MPVTTRYPQPAPIDAYGNGGFRFAGMSHMGSLLCLAAGIRDWPVGSIACLTVEAIAPVVAEKDRIDVVLFGTGALLVPLPSGVREVLDAAGVWAETMTTGSAARTYNVLLGEGRQVGAALIAVD